jgi:hypothetical protein
MVLRAWAAGAAASIVVVFAVATPTATAEPAAAKTGEIRVHVVDYSGAAYSGLKICPTKHKASPSQTSKGKLVGKCAVTNKHGVALLTKVKPGRRWATFYSSGNAQLSHEVTVRAGHTTKISWKLARGG